ncbi:MAG: nickel insertion protein [Thermoplasmatota archaeon]
MMYLTLDLRCGVSGDMLLGALLDWYEAEKGDIQPVLDIIMKAASVQSPTRVWTRNVMRGDLKAKRFYVEWERLENDTTTGAQMLSYLESGLSLTSMNTRVKKLAGRMMRILLEAEAAVHNERSVNDVHLHEAGTPDTLADVIGIAYVSDRLEVDGYWVRSTPVSLGAGTIGTEHGAFDIPVPAVRHLIRELPARHGPVNGELATPTGVAAARALVEFWMDHGDVGDCAPLKGKPVGRGAGEREYGDGFPNTLTLYEEV